MCESRGATDDRSVSAASRNTGYSSTGWRVNRGAGHGMWCATPSRRMATASARSITLGWVKQVYSRSAATISARPSRVETMSVENVQGLEKALAAVRTAG